MKKILLFSLLPFLIFSFFFIKIPKENNKFITPAIIKQVISKNKFTLVYIWTDWCSISQNNIPQSFYFLKDTFEHNKIDSVEILLVCASKFQQQIIDTHVKYHLNNSFFIKGGMLHIPFTDRMLIKNFLKQLLDQADLNKVIDDKLNFGVPIELVLDKNAKLISPFIPRGHSSIIQYIKKIEKQYEE